MDNETDIAGRPRSAIDACGKVLSQGRRPSMRASLTDLLDMDGVDGPPDVYGDGVVRQLERRVAALLGKDDAAFFPSGTMAQQAALRCWAARTGNPLVALHPLAHPVLHERDALTTLTGLRTAFLTTEPRPPAAADIADMDEQFGTLALELPLREAGFLLPAWDELAEAVRAARDRGALVHFDGARLWESTPYLGKPLAEIAALADSVYVSFYKSLGGLSGAAVAGPAGFTADVKAWRHRYGGRIYHQFPAALAALRGLDTELPRLPSYVAHAAVVAGALATAFTGTVPWFRVRPSPPHTHQFAVWLPFPADTLTQACERLAERTGASVFRRWHGTEVPGVAKTEVTVAAAALEWPADDVVASARTFASYLA